MAGGGEGLGAPERIKKGSKAHKRKKKKRVGFRLDMTPLVDITFLLLTFFMLTTTMATPQIMEMSIPPQTDPVEVPLSKLFAISVRPDGKLFWNIGLDQPQPLNLKDLKSLAVSENMRQKNELITVLKVSNDAPYGSVVTVLDVLNNAEVDITQQLAGEKRQRKFTLATLTPEELEVIKPL